MSHSLAHTVYNLFYPLNPPFQLCFSSRQSNLQNVYSFLSKSYFQSSFFVSVDHLRVYTKTLNAILNDLFSSRNVDGFHKQLRVPTTVCLTDLDQVSEIISRFSLPKSMKHTVCLTIPRLQ